MTTRPGHGHADGAVVPRGDQLEHEPADVSGDVLASEHLYSGYGSQPVIRDVTLEVPRGRIIALLGPNGAGKTTMVLSLAGELKPMSGRVYWHGKHQRVPLHRRARQGLAYVGEERSVLMTLTVLENLRVARAELAMAYDLFPELEGLAKTKAGLLSGGEQQMLALACALARRPEFLLADELSLGLAPLVVDRLFRALRRAAEELNLGVLLVEQHVSRALRLCDYAYVLRGGAIVMQGTSSEMTAHSRELQNTYL
jgi:branched-chain amino acid transport system ATP-binding protein